MSFSIPIFHSLKNGCILCVRSVTETTIESTLRQNTHNEVIILAFARMRGTCLSTQGQREKVSV